MPRRADGGQRLSRTKDLLMGKAVEFLRWKTEEDKAKKAKDKLKPEIVDLLKMPEHHEETDKGHLETELPLGDGINHVFIQLQKRVSIGMVDGALELLEKRLGKDAIEPYVINTRVLHPNALEQLLMKGVIDEHDVLELTTEKQTEALIIKANKKKTK